METKKPSLSQKLATVAMMEAASPTATTFEYQQGPWSPKPNYWRERDTKPKVDHDKEARKKKIAAASKRRNRK